MWFIIEGKQDKKCKYPWTRGDREDTQTRLGQERVRRRKIVGKQAILKKMSLITTKNSSPAMRDKENIPAYDVCILHSKLFFLAPTHRHLAVTSATCSIFCNRFFLVTRLLSYMPVLKEKLTMVLVRHAKRNRNFP